MDKIFEDKLNVFESILDSIRGTRHFPIECGNGWYPAVYAALSFAHKRNEEKQLNVKIFQIKEKFADLRIYHSGGDELTEACFSVASVIADSMCDVCSHLGYADNIGVWADGGWMVVRCEEHCDVPARESSGDYVLNEKFVSELAELVDILVKKFGRCAAQWLLKPNDGLDRQQPLSVILDEQACSKVLNILCLER
ncbi:DUF2384 domain-containing protein [Pseudomonas panipatensis]|uniref:DUF2384 domain-containing protein n=1 Tax=Pseudomonas panipatensis TaxID=428992 RepID=UPI0011145182|nr:DUF2384 domain-containing protein [Pseudomonas panipatensis]